MPQTPEERDSHLVSLADRSAEDRKQIASKGGKASAEKRAYNRTFRAAAEWALSLPAIKGTPAVEKIRKEYPGLTNQDALVISVMAKGIQEGDVKVLTALRDTVGEAPNQKLSFGTEQPMKIEIETVD